MYSLQLMSPNSANYSNIKQNNKCAGKQLSNTTGCLNLALADPGGRASPAMCPLLCTQTVDPIPHLTFEYMATPTACHLYLTRAFSLQVLCMR